MCDIISIYARDQLRGILFSSEDRRSVCRLESARLTSLLAPVDSIFLLLHSARKPTISRGKLEPLKRNGLQ